MDITDQHQKYMHERNFEQLNALYRTLVAGAPDSAYYHYEYASSFDLLGDERNAIPHYEKAIALADNEAWLSEAYLGLGSSYRCIGDYEKAKVCLETAIARFPEDEALRTFLAMTLYNTGNSNEAVALLLNVICRTTSDPTIQRFKRAISFYADRLDETF
ncbi:MAG: tetratricopeptide repeat protein [Bacilli bacterium]